MTYSLPTNIAERPTTVVGAGTLGRRIALMFANRGGVVRIFDLSEDARTEAKNFIDEQLPIAVEKAEEGKPGTIELHDDLSTAVEGAWLVVEAIPEDLDLKRRFLVSSTPLPTKTRS